MRIFYNKFTTKINNLQDLCTSLSNNRLGTDESQEWGLSGRVQCVGLMSWVNTRPLICLSSPTRCAHTREARFSDEYFIQKDNRASQNTRQKLAPDQQKL